MATLSPEMKRFVAGPSRAFAQKDVNCTARAGKMAASVEPGKPQNPDALSLNNDLPVWCVRLYAGPKMMPKQYTREERG